MVFHFMKKVFNASSFPAIKSSLSFTNRVRKPRSHCLGDVCLKWKFPASTTAIVEVAVARFAY